MTRTPPAEREEAVLRHGWAALVLASTGYAISEMVLAAGAHGRGGLRLHRITLLEYAGALHLGTLLTVLAHALPLWAVLRVAPAGRVRTALTLLFAAAAGWAAGDTLAHGDGIRSHPAALWIQAGILVSSTTLPALFAYCVLLPGRLRPLLRRLIAAPLLAAVVLFDHNLFREYRDFHGYLTAASILGFAWLFAPVATRAVAQVTAAVVLSASLVLAAWMFPSARVLESHVRRLSPLTGNLLLGLPLTHRPFFLVEAAIDPTRRLSAEESARAKRWIADRAAEISTTPRGRNVILIVLESTRADVWNDPKITPRFHEWKKHGLYVPRAVAQYPATPLAYGAMFASLPASVLVQNPFWIEHRLPVALGGAFDRWILSQPNTFWFRGSSIAKMVGPSQKTPLHFHQNAGDGLNHIWREITRLRGGKSYFAWVHLYEPHDPYVKHPKYDFGDDKPARYLSEVAKLDEDLGRFMEWYFVSEQSKDTLLLVIGDHGEGIGELVEGTPFIGHHVHVHSSASHVPFFAAGPGIPKGQERPDLHVAQMDLMPTVFDWKGVPLPPASLAHGRSLFAELKAPLERPLVTEAFSVRGSTFFGFFERVHSGRITPRRLRAEMARLNEVPVYPPRVGLEQGSLKLVRDLMVRRTSVFDLRTDPTEQRDVSDARPKDRARMEAALDAWRVLGTWTVQEADRRLATTPEKGLRPVPKAP